VTWEIVGWWMLDLARATADYKVKLAIIASPVEMLLKLLLVGLI